ncbi:MAG TPA: dihydroorotate dehydrogenase electron transfer subunit [Thiotrichales bacterium]|nr:dihydroorotate dehydrogenase electron transfer subunit [Thiotrichales bacterium]
MERPHRDTIFLEEAEILDRQEWPGGQYVLRLEAPRCAGHARPGSFVHLRCHPLRPLRRPISILRAHPAKEWIEVLFKVVGEGTRLLAEHRVGDRISLLGPIGTPFQLHPERRRPLLIGGGVGMPPMIFLADAIRKGHPEMEPLAILGSEIPFPFTPRPSTIMIPGIPDGVIACAPLLEDWGVASRLASLQGFPGCHEGYVTDLARGWLQSLDETARSEVEVFACGPHPMLEAVARLAEEFDLPAQVSLEEFMACGVGGCAGCVVEVQTPDGPAMKRVCVDGPVFDARQVFA